MLSYKPAGGLQQTYRRESRCGRPLGGLSWHVGSGLLCCLAAAVANDLPGDDADSEDTYGTASTISRGSPARWRGMLRRYVRLVLFGTGEAVEHGGLPGARSDGVDPHTCSGAAQRGCRGQPSTAWLLATYRAELGAPRSPIVEEMLRMLPRPGWS
jgi:hypothetical protein